MLEKIFKLKEKGTTVKTEVLAGVTTFLAMAYILAVNPQMLGETGMSIQGVFLATAISSAVATIIMGLLANYPVALSAGMGVNALFTYTICFGMGLSYQGALACVFVSGIIFLVISITGLRKMIINAIPAQLKLAIGAGIGFFIAFIGLKNAGIIIPSEATAVALGNLKDPAVILAVFGILVTIILLAKKVPAAVFYGLLITAVAGIVAGLCGIKGMPQLPTGVVSVDFDFSLIGAFTYVINTKTLLKVMKQAQKISSFFSLKDVLGYLCDEKQINAYEYKGYARCIDSLEHYYKYSLEFLDLDVSSAVFKSNWPIYTITNDTPPAKYLTESDVTRSFVANGAMINGTVENSIIGRDVVIGYPLFPDNR